MTVRELVVELFEDNKGVWITENRVADEAGIDQGGHGRLYQVLRELASSGYLIKKRKSYLREKEDKVILGTFSSIRGGGGFVMPRNRDRKDVFVPNINSGGAFNGDIVICRVGKFHEKTEGSVVFIVKRRAKKHVGLVEGGYLLPFGSSAPIAIDHGVKEKGYAAAVELEEREDGVLRGKKLELFGGAYDPDTPVKAVEAGYGLKKNFPEEVDKEAENFGEKVKNEWLIGRKDFRSLTTITIDPVDAKDFDDAISIEKNSDGSFRLFVHIADVSFFVREKSLLDAEARNRGNSVYLPGTVYPMLPFNLSDKLCSLNEKEDKLCMTCEMSVDTSGNVKRSFFYESVIRSAKRLTYEEAEEMIDGSGIPDEEIMNTVTTGHELASILSRKRFSRGALDFDLPEPFLSFSEKGAVEKILPLPRLKSHRLIEEFMLLANSETAEFLKKKNRHFIYRIHEEPDEEKLQTILPMLNNLSLGGSFRKKENSVKLLQNVIEAAKGKPYERLVSYQILRTMMRARYSETEAPHYGLALKRYCHFTSPIRRYPDLIVHRVLKAALKGVDHDAKELAGIAAHTTETERLADEAEREAIEWLTLIYLKEKLGDDFKAMITGFTKFGVKIELVDELIEAICPFSFIESDHFIIDKNGFSARGKFTSRLLKVGQIISAKLAKIDLFNKEAQFALE